MDAPELRRLAEAALREDVGAGDVTTEACVGPEVRARGAIVSRSQGIVAGTDIAREVFLAVDRATQVSVRVQDGAQVASGDEVLRAAGRAQALLAAERSALNFLQRLSGVATLTREFVEAAGPDVRIMDTRKTTPGLRALEKAAVRAGGGHNHRMGLYDAVLIKDNHLEAAGGVVEAVRAARRASTSGAKIEVEAKTLDQVQQALEAGANVIMLDNMDLDTMRAAVELVAGRAELEASGGVRLDNVRAIAATGVDMISVGALTHSAPSLDMSMELAVL